ncbi:BrnT family toxin, partial [Methyloglobulus morosus]|uniref:BrnT family toxin n=1 Tax=Methyloglobulus morosus TaxID=1410681 RepID=UPI000567BC19
MEYDWDKNKAVANLSKHDVSFEEAKTVFDDPFYVDFYDPDHSFAEHCFILLGKSAQGRLLFVSYMER